MIPAHFDLLLVAAHLATMRAGGTPYGELRDGAVGLSGGTIAWVGRRSDLPRDVGASRLVDCGGAWLTPGLIDCHTHLVDAGNRAHEFELRQLGATYADIAREGGGIAATVRATRAASEAELAAQSRPRIAALAAVGVTTAEVKSGYGLETAAKMKQLRVARALGSELEVTVRTTLLAAHALPPEFAGGADDYIDHVCRDVVPAVARAGLADAVDAYCETIAFTMAQAQRVFAAARAHGLPVKLHADQLSDMDGARIAAEASALSADHLEYTNEAGVAAMAKAGTVAVLLPGAFYALRESRLPPVAAFRRERVPMAIATDCNPGTSPTTSLPFMLNMACTLFRLSPRERWPAPPCTQRARSVCPIAASSQPGLRADLVCWTIW